MNKTFLLILGLFLMASCNERTANKEADQKESVTSDTTTKEKETSAEHEHNEATLMLNNGKKWKMDDSTRLNIAALNNILSGGEEKTYVLKSVRAQTDKLVRECRMQGPDHDALHLWLTGFLDHLKEAEAGKEGLGELKEDMEKFGKYFE